MKIGKIIEEGENLNLDYKLHIEMGKKIYGRFFNIAHFTATKKEMKTIIRVLKLVYAVTVDDMVIFMYKNWSGNIHYSILTIGDKVSVLELTAKR